MARDRTRDVIRAYRRGIPVGDIRKTYKISVGLIHKLLERSGVAVHELALDLASERAVVKAYREGVPPAKIRKTFGISGVQFRGIIQRRA